MKMTIIAPFTKEELILHGNFLKKMFKGKRVCHVFIEETRDRPFEEFLKDLREIYKGSEEYSEMHFNLTDKKYRKKIWDKLTGKK